MTGHMTGVIVLLLSAFLTLAACVQPVEESSIDPDPTTPESTATPTESTTTAAEDVHAFGEPCSFGEMADPAPSEPFEDLAWISHQVATGTVIEAHDPAWSEPDPGHPGRRGECLQIMTDFTVAIETHYRGEPAETLRVRVRGGEIGEYKQEIDPSPELQEGDRLLMFLGEAPESDLLPDAWIAHPQRVWHISDDDKIHGDQWLDDFDVLDLNDVDQRIRDALSSESHIIGTRLVPEEEAPIHTRTDISHELTAYGEPCSYGVDFDLDETAPFESLAWISSQVVVGNVIERHDPVFADPHWYSYCLEIVTEYTVEVETRYRGEPGETLRVRVPGGEIGEYVAEIGNTPFWEEGDRVLLFLFDAPESQVLHEAYSVDSQRAWRIGHDDRITANTALDPFDTVELAEVEERIRTALAGEPPDDYRSWVVPLDEAPVAPDVSHNTEAFGERCSFGIDYDLDPFPPFEDLAWSSEHIVVGTVVEDLGVAWAEPDNVVRPWHQNCLVIMNDDTIEIEIQMHGELAETLRIRAPGGELDGYEQLHGIAPDLETGDRYLFFLFKAPESELLPDAWAFDLQRARQVLAGDEVTAGYGEMMTLEEGEQVVTEALAGERPPDGELHRALWGSGNSETFPEWEGS